MLKKLDNVGIAVIDIGRAVTFYQSIGLTLERALEPGQTDATLRLGDTLFYLFQSAGSAGAPRGVELDANPPGLDHLSFFVDSLEDASKEFHAKGIAFLAPPVYADGFAYRGFRDSEGNVLYAIERT